MPRFNLSVPGASSGAGSPKTTETSNGQAPTGSVAPLGEREVDVPARLERGGTPHYPSAALADEIEGDVQLELVVSTAGDVENVQVVSPAGHRFDEEAVASVRNFRFSPAMKNGRPVRMRLRWTVGFRLR
jgi:protein TonB